MSSIIDVSSGCGSRASALGAAGVKTVIRYYSRDTIHPSKRLTRAEAGQLMAAGLRLAIVHEGRFGDQATNFERNTGVADATYARTYGASTIGQPGGSALYFGVDFDATADEIRSRILPYFQGIADTFRTATGEPDYLVGVYGSGATCKAVLDAGLAQFAWLAQSTGWSGYTAFLRSNRWTLSQNMPTNIGGVSCDPNDVGEGKPVGDFNRTGVAPLAPVTPAPATGAAPVTQLKVNARNGLRLRSGPGLEFDILTVLPYGRLVYPLRVSGGWTAVDLQGDGAIDGFASSAFLTDPAPSPGAAPPASAAGTTPDAMHIAELIRQGSSAAGLKAARETGKASLPGYPTNGCAVHLSALMRQAGIDVPLTWGAGKLAQIIADRGWRRVAVGSQQAGDVGVCFDNDPTPPGSDHVYLVISTGGPDEMMVADNQRTEDKPHERFATGHGKTPTEYFLRA